MPDPAPPSPAAPAQSGPEDEGNLTLHTDLLGDLRVPDSAGRHAEFRDLSARAALYATWARGGGTRRIYRSAWRAFENWCRALGRALLSGDLELLAMYATR